MATFKRNPNLPIRDGTQISFQRVPPEFLRRKQEEQKVKDASKQASATTETAEQKIEAQSASDEHRESNESNQRGAVEK